jgi:hypothetical protein
MLFDLEDYRVTGITGKDHVHVHQIRWDDSMYTQRTTFDTYYNTIRGYGAAAVVMAPASEVSTILEKSFIALEKLSSFRKISKELISVEEYHTSNRRLNAGRNAHVNKQSS